MTLEYEYVKDIQCNIQHVANNLYFLSLKTTEKYLNNLQ